LKRPTASGNTTREKALRQVEKTTGKKIKRLETRIPRKYAFCFETFFRLKMGGEITFSAISDFMELTNTRLSKFEIDAILEIEIAYKMTMNKPSQSNE